MKISEIEEMVTETLKEDTDFSKVSTTLNSLMAEIKDREEQIGQFTENNQKLMNEVANLKTVNYDYFCKLNVSQQNNKPSDNQPKYPTLDECLK